MMSSNIGKSEPVLNIKDLFYETNHPFIENKKEEQRIDRNGNDNLLILKEIESILHKCSNLTIKQKLDYCMSQRYFMKIYLREINRE